MVDCTQRWDSAADMLCWREETKVNVFTPLVIMSKNEQIVSAIDGLTGSERKRGRNDPHGLWITYLYAKVIHSKSFVSEASIEICDMLAFPK